MIHTLHLFQPLHAALLTLLRELQPDDWHLPTVCDGWSVHDVAIHLLGGDVSILSRFRDDHQFIKEPINGWEDLLRIINQINADWVTANRRISPPMLIDMLTLTGQQVTDHFHTWDLEAAGGPVEWADTDAAPIWLDLAREFTERWHHQQHIRDAVGRPGLADATYLDPVLRAFVQALPRAYQGVTGAEGIAVQLVIGDPVKQYWMLSQTNNHWKLREGNHAAPAATVKMSGDTAWRLFTKGITPDAALSTVTLSGDQELAKLLLATVSIIA